VGRGDRNTHPSGHWTQRHHHPSNKINKVQAGKSSEINLIHFSSGATVEGRSGMATLVEEEEGKMRKKTGVGTLIHL